MEFISRFTLDDYKEIKATVEDIDIKVGDLVGLKRSDGANIPICEDNRDYQEYLTIKEL